MDSTEGLFEYQELKNLCLCNLSYVYVNSKVPTKAEEITIPADVTPEKVPTHIVDYSGKHTNLKLFSVNTTRQLFQSGGYSVDF